MDCSFQEVGKNMSCFEMSVKGDIIIKNMKNGSDFTQKLLDEFSKREQETYSFDEFVKWLMNSKNR